MAIIIKPIATLTDNYVWIIINHELKTALVVDPGDAAPVQAFIEQNHLQLKGILITHHHWDHTNGVPELKERYHPIVVGPKHDGAKHLDCYVSEHDQVRIDGIPITFTVLDIPGHTHGHIAYYAPGMLFCGDTLFAAGCGRLFEGTAEQMYASLQKMAALPDETKIYCAHEYTVNNLRFAAAVEPSNQLVNEKLKRLQGIREPTLPSVLKEEKETNPFLRCEEKDVIRSAEEQAGIKLTHPVEVFRVLRHWKDQFPRL